MNESSKPPDDKENAAYCLTIPGKKLYIQPLLAMKRFRYRGNKRGAIRAIYLLEKDGLAKVIELTNSKGTTVVSHCDNS